VAHKLNVWNHLQEGISNIVAATRNPFLVPIPSPGKLPVDVVTIAGGPAIVHSNDYSLVTVAKPAQAGEVLTLFASGLGPTRPAPEPGQPFAADPLPVVNSPVEMIVNGASGQVLYAGAVDRYQVNFRVPAGISSGMASLHLSSAWIAGGNVTIPIQ